MRVLVAYDGSRCSEAALDDLSRAGLPAEGEALVITIAEVWLPPPSDGVDGNGDSDELLIEAVERHREKGQRLVNEAELRSKHAAGRIRVMLPGWQVRSESTYGSPAWEILAAAEKFCPDLILVGSHGHSALGRLILGSVSQKVMTEAKCSVRVARGRIGVEPAPIRLVAGYDGSAGADAAIDAIVCRSWPSDTEIRLVAATGSLQPVSVGRFGQPGSAVAASTLEKEFGWIYALIESASAKLKAAGLTAVTSVVEGDPNRVLIQEATTFNADAIFTGANAHAGRFERYLIGSCSAAVAARAHCSVEVVRLGTK